MRFNYGNRMQSLGRVKCHMCSKGMMDIKEQDLGWEFDLCRCPEPTPQVTGEVEKAIEEAARNFNYKYPGITQSFGYMEGARFGYSLRSAEIEALKKEVETLRSFSWRYYKAQNAELTAKFEVAREALRECAKYKNCDDVNGQAGDICAEALQKIDAPKEEPKASGRPGTRLE